MSGPSEKTTARVVTAEELKEYQLFALSELLSKKLNKQVEISAHTDASLIGGLYLEVDGRVIDCTVKKQINDMKSSIRKGGAG